MNKTFSNNKYVYLTNEPISSSNYLEECIHPNDKVCEVIANERMILYCKGCKEGLGYKDVSAEKVACFACNDAPHRLYSKTKYNNKYLCIKCWKNKLLHGVSEHYGKNVDVIIKAINKKACREDYAYRRIAHHQKFK